MAHDLYFSSPHVFLHVPLPLSWLTIGHANVGQLGSTLHKLLAGHKLPECLASGKYL